MNTCVYRWAGRYATIGITRHYGLCFRRQDTIKLPVTRLHQQKQYLRPRSSLSSLMLIATKHRYELVKWGAEGSDLGVHLLEESKNAATHSRTDHPRTSLSRPDHTLYSFRTYSTKSVTRHSAEQMKPPGERQCPLESLHCFPSSHELTVTSA